MTFSSNSKCNARYDLRFNHEAKKKKQMERLTTQARYGDLVDATIIGDDGEKKYRVRCAKSGSVVELRETAAATCAHLKRQREIDETDAVISKLDLRRVARTKVPKKPKEKVSFFDKWHRVISVDGQEVTLMRNETVEFRIVKKETLNREEGN